MGRMLIILLAAFLLATPAAGGKKEEALAKVRAFLDEGDLENALKTQIQHLVETAKEAESEVEVEKARREIEELME